MSYIDKIKKGSEEYEIKDSNLASFLSPFEDELLIINPQSSVPVSDEEIDRLVNGLTNHLRLKISDTVFTVTSITDKTNNLEVVCDSLIASVYGFSYYVLIDKVNKTLTTAYSEI